jgi:hypothetical protein
MGVLAVYIFAEGKVDAAREGNGGGVVSDAEPDNQCRQPKEREGKRRKFLVKYGIMQMGDSDVADTRNKGYDK